MFQRSVSEQVADHRGELTPHPAGSREVQVDSSTDGHPFFSGTATLHPHSVDLILMAARGDPVTGVQARLGGVDREGAVVTSDPLVEAATIWS